METQRTCGQGLAANSALPAKLSELTAAVARNLEVHLQALDLTDANAKQERDAYGELAKQHRDIAAQLRATAEQMAGYRNLPMGKHDQDAMTSPRVLEAFEAFVKVENDLLILLQGRVKQDQQMLTAIRAAVGSAPPSNIGRRSRAALDRP
jgi:hypothetical protein